MDPRSELANQAEVYDPTAQVSPDGESREDVPDPLADVTLDALIKHPKLGSELKSWADTQAARQAKGREAVIARQVEERIRPQVEQQVRDKQLSEYVKRLPREELAQRLADDTDFAADYARVTADEHRAPDVTFEATKRAYEFQLSSYLNMLDKSDLPDGTKAQLAPENFDFPNRGDEGFTAWQTAISEAIIDHKAGVRGEANRQSSLAKEDEGKGGAVGVIVAPATRAPGALTRAVWDKMTFDQQAVAWKKIPDQVRALK